MKILSTLKHRIFLRIYTGLLLLCLTVVFFGYQLFNTINEQRAQSYREQIATGTFHIIAQDIIKQKNKEQRDFWLEDASSLFGSDFQIKPVSNFKFTARETQRLHNQLSVVQYDKDTIHAKVYYKIPNEDNIIKAEITQVDEKQVRAFGIFLLDYLSYYDTQEERNKHLKKLSEKFSFPISYKNILSVDIDSDQLTRLYRNEVVVLFLDSTSISSTTINVLVPSNVSDTIIEIGPLPLFNWFPLRLVSMIVIFSTLLISLGVYALIFPLEKKLQLLQAGLNDVSEGKLDTRLIVSGEDETAKLSATFNAMASHIKRLIESQRELTRAVSHELRTPVARIRFAVDMLADTDDEASRRNQRDFIDQDIEELNGLIDEILTYAKLEEGSPKMNWEIVNLRDLLKQVIRETNALGKPIELSVEYSNIRMFAEADELYLHRVVQNLVGNSLRYAESKILVTAGVKKGVAFVSVEDDGHGIPEADREKVFIPFARLDDSRTRSSGGYGLGLSIISRICFWFNGEMSVDESPQLGGARFTMSWPVKQLTKTIIADNLTQKHNERKVIREDKFSR